MSTVKLPGLGNVKSTYVIAGGALVLGIVGYAYYKHRQSSSTTASTTGTSTTGDLYPPDGTTGNPADPYSTDPNSGTTYGDEGNLSGDYGYGTGYDAGAYGTAGYGGYGGAYGGSTTGPYGQTYDGYEWDAATGAYDIPITTGTGTVMPTPIVTTNAEWSQEVTTGLESIGYSATSVAQALGIYLSNGTLTTDEAAIVQAAVAEYGPPPVGTFTINTGGNGTTNPAPKPGTATVPNVIGWHGEAAGARIKAAGLVSRATPATTPKGKTTTVVSTNPVAGKKVPHGSVVAVELKVS